MELELELDDEEIVGKTVMRRDRLIPMMGKEDSAMRRAGPTSSPTS